MSNSKFEKLRKILIQKSLVWKNKNVKETFERVASKQYKQTLYEGKKAYLQDSALQICKSSRSMQPIHESIAGTVEPHQIHLKGLSISFLMDRIETGRLGTLTQRSGVFSHFK